MNLRIDWNHGETAESKANIKLIKIKIIWLSPRIARWLKLIENKWDQEKWWNQSKACWKSELQSKSKFHDRNEEKMIEKKTKVGM